PGRRDRQQDRPRTEFDTHLQRPGADLHHLAAHKFEWSVPLEQDHKRRAAPTEKAVARRAIRQPLCEVHEDLIAYAIAEARVDALQALDNKHGGKHTLAPLDRLRQHALGFYSRRQPGDGIGLDLPRFARLHALDALVQAL